LSRPEARARRPEAVDWPWLAKCFDSMGARKEWKIRSAPLSRVSDERAYAAQSTYRKMGSDSHRRKMNLKVK
jgi:hypothetical protein